MINPIELITSKVALIEENKELHKAVDTLTIENNELKEKNKKCQQNINKVNSYWKGKMRSKK